MRLFIAVLLLCTSSVFAADIAPDLSNHDTSELLYVDEPMKIDNKCYEITPLYCKGSTDPFNCKTPEHNFVSELSKAHFSLYKQNPDKIVYILKPNSPLFKEKDLYTAGKKPTDVRLFLTLEPKACGTKPIKKYPGHKKN